MMESPGGGFILTPDVVINYPNNDRDHCLHFITNYEPNLNSTSSKNSVFSPTAKHVITSKAIVWLLSQSFKIDSDVVKGYDLNKSYQIEYQNKIFIFALIESKHSAASVSLLLHDHKGTYLYTGPFCYYKSFLEQRPLIPVVETKCLAKLYYDGTYFTKEHILPNFDQSVDEIVRVIRTQKDKPIFIAVSNLATFSVVKEVGARLKEKISVSQNDWKYLKVLGYSGYFVAAPKVCRVKLIRSRKLYARCDAANGIAIRIVWHNVVTNKHKNRYIFSKNTYTFHMYAHSWRNDCLHLINALAPKFTCAIFPPLPGKSIFSPSIPHLPLPTGDDLSDKQNSIDYEEENNYPTPESNRCNTPKKTNISKVAYSNGTGNINNLNGPSYALGKRKAPEESGDDSLLFETIYLHKVRQKKALEDHTYNIDCEFLKKSTEDTAEPVRQVSNVQATSPSSSCPFKQNNKVLENLSSESVKIEFQHNDGTADNKIPVNEEKNGLNLVPLNPKVPFLLTNMKKEMDNEQILNTNSTKEANNSPNRKRIHILVGPPFCPGSFNKRNDDNCETFEPNNQNLLSTIDNVAAIPDIRVEGISEMPEHLLPFTHQYSQNEKASFKNSSNNGLLSLKENIHSPLKLSGPNSTSSTEEKLENSNLSQVPTHLMSSETLKENIHSPPKPNQTNLANLKDNNNLNVDSLFLDQSFELNSEEIENLIAICSTIHLNDTQNSASCTEKMVENNNLCEVPNDSISSETLKENNHLPVREKYNNSNRLNCFSNLDGDSLTSDKCMKLNSKGSENASSSYYQNHLNVTKITTSEDKRNIEGRDLCELPAWLVSLAKDDSNDNIIDLNGVSNVLNSSEKSYPPVPINVDREINHFITAEGSSLNPGFSSQEDLIKDLVGHFAPISTFKEGSLNDDPQVISECLNDLLLQVEQKVETESKETMEKSVSERSRCCIIRHKDKDKKNKVGKGCKKVIRNIALEYCKAEVVLEKIPMHYKYFEHLKSYWPVFHGFSYNSSYIKKQTSVIHKLKNYSVR